MAEAHPLVPELFTTQVEPVIMREAVQIGLIQYVIQHQVSRFISHLLHLIYGAIHAFGELRWTNYLFIMVLLLRRH